MNETKKIFAVYFYEKNQCFKVDESQKKQLNNPIKLFEAKSKKIKSFFAFFNKEYQKLIENNNQKKIITRTYIEDLVKKHHLFKVKSLFI